MAKDTSKKNHQILNETDQREKMKMKKNKSGSSPEESSDFNKSSLHRKSSSSSSSALKRKRGVAGDSSNGGNKATSTSTSGGSTSRNVNKNGLDEIDSLFTAKKQHDLQEKHKQQKQEADAKKAKREKRNMMMTSTIGGTRIHGTTKSSASHPAENLGTNDWVDDGLGGRFNGEGYTGRVEDGIKIFKAHILNRPGAGSTKHCPFDCDCCFI